MAVRAPGPPANLAAKVAGLELELRRNDGVCQFKNGNRVERLRGGEYRVVRPYGTVILTQTPERAYIVAMGLSGRRAARTRDVGDGARFGDSPF